ncbi:uncharacterized protein LOC119551787 isoform X2 [Drosophila subpulchrella]|uniref:uncharacterized protein LOC119551787 isoform X2 n=1 Tax=Drosophila subpulchrella TaxID=1486046 RepID=UPI0018A19EBB|nr:uncharacterized protein LOC119551787 isoform X2 [Drosophila subpulchrella]
MQAGLFHLNCTVRKMKTSFGWFFLLLSHVSAYRFLEESCGTWPAYKLTNVAWLANIRNATHFHCHGTLIHRRFVLTAARCIYPPRIIIGSHVEFGSATYNVSLFVVHKEYLQNDIGLLKLSRNVDFNAFVYPICIILDMENRNYVKNTIKFTTTASIPNYNTAEVIKLRQLNRNYCQMHLNSNSNQICAYSTAYRVFCSLELGGPLTQYISIDNSTREVQFGIRSVGEKGCNKPRVYTDLTNYDKWIEETIQRYSGIWLYENCSGNILSSKLRAFIYGYHFRAQGWFITDRFVITNAINLPEDPFSLDVGLAETPRSYDEFRVHSIFKHKEFSQYYKNDIALLKLNRPVTFDKMSPVCMLAMKNHRDQAESALYFTIFYYVQTENHITLMVKNVSLIDPIQCSNTTGNTIDQNQVCVQASQGMSYGNPGDILIKKIMYKAKEWIVLVGIVSYSSNGVQVFTNVMRHTDWITHVVHSNQ